MDGTIVSLSPVYTFTVTESATYIAHFAAQTYTVTVSSNPAEGGMVSGGGTFTYGQTCTVHASASDCYSFTNWTENGNVVSSQADYSFTVMGSRSLVANFDLQSYTINIDIEPGNGGTVTGAGTYGCGETATLEAVPNENYVFVAWLEDGSVISFNPTMMVSVVSDLHFTAKFAFVDGIGEKASLIEVYPNPANDVLYIKGEGIRSVTVFNALGQVVERVECGQINNMIINTNNYTSGCYAIYIETTTEVVKNKFIKY